MSEKPSPKAHSHSHSHAAASRSRLAWAVAVTVTVMVVELLGAWLSGSLALAADAGHMLTDSLGLVVALVAATLMTRPRSKNRTWGFARAEVLAAGLQAGLLIALCVLIAYEGVQRILAPAQISPVPMLWVGVAGLTGNMVSVFILAKGRNDSLNMKAAFLEVMSDALGAIAVLIAAVVLITTGWPYADSIASLVIASLIFVRAVAILRQSMSILMEKTPKGLDIGEVESVLKSDPSVVAVHDLHAGTIGTGLNTLTAHVVVTEQCVRDGQTVEVLHRLQDAISRDLPVDLNHVTLQIDSAKHAAHETLSH